MPARTTAFIGRYLAVENCARLVRELAMESNQREAMVRVRFDAHATQASPTHEFLAFPPAEVRASFEPVRASRTGIKVAQEHIVEELETPAIAHSTEHSDALLAP